MALSSKQAEKYGEKFLDLANISLAALAFGSLISEKGFQVGLIILGVVLYGGFSMLGLVLIGRSG